MRSPLELILPPTRIFHFLAKLSLMQHQSYPVLRLPQITKVTHKQSSHCLGLDTLKTLSSHEGKDWHYGIEEYKMKMGRWCFSPVLPSTGKAGQTSIHARKLSEGASLFLWDRISLAALHGPCCFLWVLPWTNCSNQNAAHSKENWT